MANSGLFGATRCVAEIGRQSHAQIVGTVSKPHDVSQDVEAAPLLEALERLLGDQNFTLTPRLNERP